MDIWCNDIEDLVRERTNDLLKAKELSKLRCLYVYMNDEIDYIEEAIKELEVKKGT